MWKSTQISGDAKKSVCTVGNALTDLYFNYLFQGATDAATVSRQSPIEEYKKVILSVRDMIHRKVSDNIARLITHIQTAFQQTYSTVYPSPATFIRAMMIVYIPQNVHEKMDELQIQQVFLSFLGKVIDRVTVYILSAETIIKMGVKRNDPEFVREFQNHLIDSVLYVREEIYGTFASGSHTLALDSHMLHEKQKGAIRSLVTQKQDLLARLNHYADAYKRLEAEVEQLRTMNVQLQQQLAVNTTTRPAVAPTRANGGARTGMPAINAVAAQLSKLSLTAEQRQKLVAETAGTGDDDAGADDDADDDTKTSTGDAPVGGIITIQKTQT